MVMKNNVMTKIIIAIVIVVLCIPIISDMIANSTLTKIDYSEYSDTIDSTSSYKYAFIYVDDSSEDGVKEKKKEVKALMEQYLENTSGTSGSANYMDSKDMTKDELKDVLGSSDVKSGYVFIVNSEVIRVEDASISDSDLEKLLKAYSLNGMDSDLVNYKVAEDAAAYKKLVKQKNTVTMAVFGRDNCFYCNQFKLVYNTVAKEEGIDIYYFNSQTYDEEEYDAIMNLGLKIPASCTDSGEEETLESGFSTPLTLFTKNGKVIDCIGGYVNKETLITKLETLGMIEED